MKCAYCNLEGKMTKEHVIPNGFINKMDKKNSLTWNEKSPIGLVNADITIKDVCASCNNGVLSELDAYALKLILEYNNRISIYTKDIYFRYNYDMLCRWLLKVCYNSARVNDGAFDNSVYQKTINYILTGEKSESYIALYGMFAGTGCLNEKFAKHIHHLQEQRNFEIDHFRIGPFRINNNEVYSCASRFIMINSFVFVLIVCDDEHQKDFIRINEQLNKSEAKFFELTSLGKTKLKRDDKFFIQSIETNLAIRGNYLTKRTIKDDNDLLLLNITKEEIEKEDYSIFNALRIDYLQDKDAMMDAYQKILITLEGYENEEREPYQSRSFQNYFRKVFNYFPGIIWLLNLEIDWPFHFALVYACINDNYTDDLNDNTTHLIVDTETVVEFMKTIFLGINKLIQQNCFDLSKNKELTDKFLCFYRKCIPTLYD